MRSGGLWRCGLIAALLTGAVLRFVWVEDMEYKGDEAWTFDRTQNAGRSEPFPLVGLPTSLEFRNPGMSVWTFLALGRLAGVGEPTGLARACQALNVAALFVLVAFALRWVDAEQREPWLWAAALASVNPLAVVFQRKIWPPSIFPLFSMLLLIGWWRRDRRAGAFACGLIGVILGQMHLSGFFFVAGLAVWALLFDRRRVAWLSWLAGSLCGLLPLLPWLADVARHWAEWPARARFWAHAPEPKFWTHWFTEPFGIGLKYALGEDFATFFAGPPWHGRPTYGVALLHAVVGVTAGIIVIRAAIAVWRERGSARELLTGRRSETAFIVSAGVWGYGLVFNAACLRFYRHYLLVAFPLTFVWAAQLALAPAGAARLRHARALLLVLCVAQALISVSFLVFVHQHQDGVRGDYGVPYAAQARPAVRALRPAPPP